MTTPHPPAPDEVTEDAPDDALAPEGAPESSVEEGAAPDGSENSARPAKPPWWERTLRTLARIDTVFGSDVYVDYSHRYVWQANQFGHLLIGVVATMLFGWAFGSFTAGLVTLALVYTLKEAIDAAIALRFRTDVFSLDVGEIVRDGLVDLAFVTLGGVLCLCAAPTSSSGLDWFGEVSVGNAALPIALAGTVGFFLFVRRPFLARKGMFDKSGLPQLVRLSTFPDAFEPQESDGEAVRAIERFARDGSGEGIPDQIVITGAPGSGRSTLAKGIGGDATASLRKVRALSAARLIEKRRVGGEPASAPEQPWAVCEADLVIIDDIPVDLLAALGDARGMVSGLIDPRGSEVSILEQAPRDDVPSTEGVREITAAARPVPALVWVIDEPIIARRFATRALAERFPGAEVLIVELEGRLNERRESERVS